MKIERINVHNILLRMKVTLLNNNLSGNLGRNKPPIDHGYLFVRYFGATSMKFTYLTFVSWLNRYENTKFEHRISFCHFARRLLLGEWKNIEFTEQ